MFRPVNITEHCGATNKIYTIDYQNLNLNTYLKKKKSEF